MPGRVVNALIHREAEAYRAQGLPEEALNLLETTLLSDPELSGDARAGFLAQIGKLRSEIPAEVPDEQDAVTDEAIAIIRRGWVGSDTREDHLECAAGFHLLGRCADALDEFASAVRSGQPLSRILPQLADCLARAYPPQEAAPAAARLAGAVLPRSLPGTAFLFALVTAETMADAGHAEHAAALTRSLAVSGEVPERCRVRLQALVERLRVPPGGSTRPPFSKRLAQHLPTKP
jgi:hypothetical protein